MSLNLKLKEDAGVAIGTLKNVAQNGTNDQRIAAAVELMRAIATLHQLENPGY